MTRRRLARTFWIGAAAALVVAALIALAAVLRGDFSDTDGRILATLAALLLAGGTLVSGLVLVDRDDALLGRVAVVVAPLGFGLLAYAIWDFVFDGGGDAWRYGWTGVVLLIATLIAVTARLLAESASLTPLATIAGILAALAAVLSSYAIWDRNASESMGKALAVIWILTGATYLLVPVLERFRSAQSSDPEARVLAALDDVQLVLTRSNEGLEVVLAPGERLALRRNPNRAAT
ncbi:MAG TPA: hypothetical protein VFG70_07535 [Gaiellaceae bacterium]|nr:hypothetical protein [Gaiellaceae bacterium]